MVGHQKQWDFLKRKFEQGQISHAYLFAGDGRIGKKFFTVELTKLINCKGEQPPCQKCFSCRAIEKGSFPDFKLITKKEDKNEIEILQIREVQNFLSYKAYYGSFKIVAIDDAEKMNKEAQSCFLKTLEEPKGKTILFLISSKPDLLLETIVSRCQTLKFFRPKDLPLNREKLEKEQKIFKELSGVMGSTFSDKFKYVKSIDFERQDPLEILEVIQKYLRYLMLLKTGAGVGKSEESFFSGSNILQNYPVSKVKKAITLSEEINNTMLFTNANPKLALEILLMEI